MLKKIIKNFTQRPLQVLNNVIKPKKSSFKIPPVVYQTWINKSFGKDHHRALSNFRKLNPNISFYIFDEFELEGQFEKLVYEDIVYIHNLENNKVYNLNDEEIGVYKNKRIKWTDDEYKKQHLVAKDKYNEEYNKELVLSSSEDEDDSSDESSSDDEGILEEISDIKKEVDNIKYRKHKLSLKCMSNVTPKVYNNKFRGWGLTYWGD